MVVASIVVVALGGLADHGVDVIGEIEGAVPVPALPSVGWDELLTLLPGTLAIAIAYPDLTATAGTVLNQTGQAVENVLIMMLVYLVLSLVTSAVMNVVNARMALVER